MSLAASLLYKKKKNMCSKYSTCALKSKNHGLAPKKKTAGVWMVSEFTFYHKALNLNSKKDGYK